MSKLLNIQNIQKFYTTLKQEGKAATTIVEKLRRVREAVKFIKFGLEESDNITHTLYPGTEGDRFYIQ